MKVIDAIIILISVTVGYCFGMLTQYYSHREQMKAYEVMLQKPQLIEQPKSRGRR